MKQSEKVASVDLQIWNERASFPNHMKIYTSDLSFSLLENKCVVWAA